MRDFMTFCLEILKQLVALLFNFDVGGYSYGSFLVVTLLVSALIGALVVHFNPKVPSGVSRPPKLHDD